MDPLELAALARAYSEVSELRISPPAGQNRGRAVHDNRLAKMRERMLRETEEFLTRSLKARENASRKQISVAALADSKAKTGRNKYRRYHNAERSRQ